MAKRPEKPEWQVYEEKVQGLLLRLPLESHRLALGLLLLAASSLPDPEPELVAALVLERAAEKARLNPKARPLLQVVQAEPELLLEAARWALWLLRLPRERKSVYRRYSKTGWDEGRMLSDAPSDRQLAYLEALGYRGAPPSNKLEASLLIDDLVAWQRSAQAFLKGKPAFQVQGRLKA
jgi:hypothetical protein